MSYCNFHDELFNWNVSVLPLNSHGTDLCSRWFFVNNFSLQRYNAVPVRTALLSFGFFFVLVCLLQTLFVPMLFIRSYAALDVCALFVPQFSNQIACLNKKHFSDIYMSISFITATIAAKFRNLHDQRFWRNAKFTFMRFFVHRLIENFLWFLVGKQSDKPSDTSSSSFDEQTALRIAAFWRGKNIEKSSRSFVEMKPEIKKFSLLQMHFDGWKCCFLHGQLKEEISMSEGKKNLIKISFSAFFFVLFWNSHKNRDERSELAKVKHKKKMNWRNFKLLWRLVLV